MEVSDIRTGDRVLCKVGDYPPWPAVVVPQRFLNQSVYKQRKKNHVAVAFFNDSSYYWKEPRLLPKLTSETCEEWLSSHTRPSNKDLFTAYKQALQYENLYIFIRNRLKDEGGSNMIKDIHDIPEGEDPFQPKDSSNNRHSLKRPRSQSPTVRIHSPKSIVHNGTEVYKSKDSGDNFLKVKKSVSEHAYSMCEKKKNGIEYNNRVEFAKLLRTRLQKNLVQRDTPPTHDDLLESHKLFKKIIVNLDSSPPFFDKEALKNSKLHKLLKFILNDDNLKDFHQDCNSILMCWSQIITELKQEKAKNI